MALHHNPRIVTSGLVLALDAADVNSYPGSGTTWYDLSGNNNHFTLYNGVTHDPTGYFETDGSSDYIRSTNTVDLSGYTHIVADIWIRTLNTTTFHQAFEHSNNWNTNSGAFGLFLHSNGSAATANEHHTNHKDQLARNYVMNIGTSWSNHINLYSAIVDSTGRQAWGNGILETFESPANPSYGGTTATAGDISFRDDHFYMGARGGTSAFAQVAISSFRVYGFKFTNSTVEQNYEAQKTRFGL